MFVLPSCVIAGHIHGPGELAHARARRGVVALYAYAMGGANTEREQSSAKGTITGRTSRDAVTFHLSPVGLSKLVRARRGVVALNAYAMGCANAKREQSAAKGTLADLARK